MWKRIAVLTSFLMLSWTPRSVRSDDVQPPLPQLPPPPPQPLLQPLPPISTPPPILQPMIHRLNTTTEDSDVLVTVAPTLPPTPTTTTHRALKLNTLTTDCDHSCASNSACIRIGQDSIAPVTCAGETMNKCFTSTAKNMICLAAGFTKSEDEWEFAPAANVSSGSGIGPFEAIGTLNMSQASILTFGHASASLHPLEMPLDVSDMRVVDGFNLSTVEFSRLRLTGLDAASPLDGVYIININHCELQSIPIRLVSGSNVTFLNLADNVITDVSAFEQHAFTQLTRLNLSSNAIRDFALDKATFPALKTLILSKNDLKTIPDVVFELSTLKRLEMESNPFEQPMALADDQLRFLATLQKLVVSDVIATTTCPNDPELIKKLGNVIQFCSNADGTPSAESTTSTSRSSGSKTWIFLGVLVGIVVFFALIMIVYRRCKMRQEASRFKHTMATTPSMMDHQHPYYEMPAPTRHDDASSSQLSSLTSGRSDVEDDLVASLEEGVASMCRLSYNDVFLHKMVRVSSRSELWLGEYLDESVLIKKMKRQSVSRAVLRSFLLEIEQMAALQHPRIVAFKGALWDAEGSELCAVVEYMENGALRDVIRNHISLPVPKQHAIARQIAEALAFLHAQGLVHGRLNAFNVLLDREFSAKLSLFSIFHHVPLSPLDVECGIFVAPEVRRGERPRDRSDVYSFGVLLVELDGEETPVINAKRTSSVIQQSAGECGQEAFEMSPATRRTGFRFSATCSSMMKEIITACLEREPTARPTMDEIVACLQTGEMTL